MNDNKFHSLKELYDHLYPAFNTKVNMLKSNNIIIKEVQLWQFLKDNYWTNNKDLDIYKMVDDILSLDDDIIKKDILGEYYDN